MCGRFALTVPASTLVEVFEIEQNFCDTRPSYNIAPGRYIAAIVCDDKKKLLPFKWGLVPFWAKDPAIGNRMINARAETVNQKPSFKNALKQQRCLIIASGFYEWKKKGPGKTPVYVKPKSDTLFCLAGLYDYWQSRDGSRLGTCTIITSAANVALKPIHDRMPVIVEKDNQQLWLDSINREDKILPLLKPHEKDDLEIYQVSTLVNSPDNDSPQCIKPLQLQLDL